MFPFPPACCPKQTGTILAYLFARSPHFGQNFALWPSTVPQREQIPPLCTAGVLGSGLPHARQNFDAAPTACPQ